MKLLILGGTGATGKHLVDAALAEGHEVTALVRDTARLPTQPKLHALKGLATAASDVEAAVRGQDAVLSTLGPRSNADPVCAAAAEATVAAMKNAGIKRVVWLSAGGVGDSKTQIVAASFVFGRIIMPLFLAKPYAHHARAEETLRSSGLDWTVIRPLQLVDKPTGNPAQAVAIGNEPVKGLKIARRDVATFMLSEVTARAYVGRMPLLHT